MLELTDIKGGYKKDQLILNNINLTVRKNEIVTVIGFNGAGKSTLAKAILNLLPYREGKVLLNNEDISNQKVQDITSRNTGYFLQGGQLFPHLTVYENLQIARYGLSKKEFINRLSELIERFNFIDRNISKEAGYLSGGERNLVALAMVLIRKPKLLILDEPSAGLDEKNVNKLYDILMQIRTNDNITMLLIEQKIDKALSLSDNIIYLENGKVSEEIINQNKSKTIEEINRKIFKY